MSCIHQPGAAQQQDRLLHPECLRPGRPPRRRHVASRLVPSCARWPIV